MTSPHSTYPASRDLRRTRSRRRAAGSGSSSGYLRSRTSSCCSFCGSALSLSTVIAGFAILFTCSR